MVVQNFTIGHLNKTLDIKLIPAYILHLNVGNLEPLNWNSMAFTSKI